MTAGGGNYADGVIFSFDPVSSVYRKLKDFDDSDGIQPAGSLVQAGNGKLYGMTSGGGSTGGGVLFPLILQLELILSRRILMVMMV